MIQALAALAAVVCEAKPRPPWKDCRPVHVALQLHSAGPATENTPLPELLRLSHPEEPWYATIAWKAAARVVYPLPDPVIFGGSKHCSVHLQVPGPL